MALSEAEKLQVETAVDAFIGSSNVQAVLAGFITRAESTGVAALDNIINNAKAGGLLGGILNAFKGSAEAEVNTFITSLPPAAVAALITKDVEGEIKTLLGA